MSKMGLAGQDVLTRKYDLPTLAGDNKLYTRTQNNNVDVPAKRKETKQIYVLQDLDIGTFWAGIKVHLLMGISVSYRS